MNNGTSVYYMKLYLEISYTTFRNVWQCMKIMKSIKIHDLHIHIYFFQIDFKFYQYENDNHVSHYDVNETF